MPVQTQLQTRRGTAASWTSTNPTLAAGEFGYETDTGKFKIGNGSTAWASLAYTAAATAVTYLFNATSGQTTFSGADANGLTLAYTVGAEQVYLNGVLQVRGSDYTATNGTSIVLASGALTSDVLNVIAYSAMTITDTYTQAQADAKFVQQTNNFFAGKNKIINGDFGIWQRGTSVAATSASAVFLADRWQTYQNGSGTFTVSQQAFTPGTAPVAGYEAQYFIRNAITTLGSTTAFVFYQAIEDVRTLAGQTVTVSFWSKSASSTGASINFSQNFGTGGSASVTTTVSSGFVNTTSWQRFSFTVTLPSIAGKTIGANNNLTLNFVTPLAANQSVDYWGVQVEAGSIATPFQTATGTLAGELAACQRYYWRSSPGTAYGLYAWARGYSTTGGTSLVNFPVQMRIVPTSVDYANLRISDTGTGGTAATSVAIVPGESATLAVQLDIASTTFRDEVMFVFQNNNNTTGYLGFSAEL